MKLSMEIMYVPVASINEKRDMMADWKNTSTKARNFSLVAAAMCAFASLMLRFYNEPFFYIFVAGAVIFLLGALLVHKWSFWGYTAVIVATALCCLRTLIPLPQEFLLLITTLAGVFVGLLPCVYTFRCLYNYNDVFLELKKFKEFPEFIRNTADLYGDKIYIKDTDDNSYDEKFKAAYNPFNTQADVYREEFIRNQQLKGKRKPVGQIMDVDTNKDNVSFVADKEKVKTFFGYPVFMLKGNPDNTTMPEKKVFMNLWRENNLLAERNYKNVLLCLALCVMIGGFGSFAGMVNYLALLVFTSGVTYMKLSNPVAPVIIIGSLAYVGALTNNVIGLLFLCMALFQYRWAFVSIIRFYLNYGTYKKLKGMQGFPSFISTTSDLYGDKMYILEEQKPVVKNINGKQKIVMNIGFDEPKKTEDKAWNAFDYMDEENTEDESNRID